MNPLSPPRFLYGSTPAEFKSAFGMQESAARLRAATRRSAFGFSSSTLPENAVARILFVVAVLGITAYWAW